jgi:hypothetical protein
LVLIPSLKLATHELWKIGTWCFLKYSQKDDILGASGFNPGIRLRSCMQSAGGTTDITWCLDRFPLLKSGIQRVPMFVEIGSQISIPTPEWLEYFLSVK